jgi:phospholipid/cholesterol/gamma-HCH transport system substrate-binding protein
MESAKRAQMIVGIFLLVGLAVVMISIFSLGADRALFKSFSSIHARFEQVQGLARGSIVSLSGIVVGNVENIEFINDKLDVTMKIEEKYVKRITEGSQVEIRTQGALGDKYVFIIPGRPDQPPVKDGAILTVARPSDIIGIFSERGKESEKIFDIIDELHKMVTAINDERRLEKIMTNMAAASENLNATAEKTKAMAAGLAEGSPQVRFNRSLEKFERIVDKIDRGQGTLGGLINDPAVHERLKTVLGANQRKNQVKDLLRTSIEKAEGN